MAIHNHLPVYKLAQDLLRMSASLTRHYPRHQRGIATRINDACLSMLVLIARANAARRKIEILDELLEQLHVAEILFRLSLDEGILSDRQYARAADVCARVGNQAGGWRRSQQRNASGA
ncbi:four helix bundle protein [Paracandidimonas soli]|uniref:four helix bundle protein n=1 Tax=Paracandidimonas soli TaxID=1917182 RepID=UPI0010428D03|nr:four helix bundle protein [Paracandidimonas soli]